MKYHIIEKSFFTEFCSWSEHIEAQISDELCIHVQNARNILKYNPYIDVIFLETPQGFLKEDVELEMQSLCRFDIENIIIKDIFVLYRVQSKYSKMITAEYDLTHLIPHAVTLEFEKSGEGLNKDIDSYLGITQKKEDDYHYVVQTYVGDDWENTWSIVNDNGLSVPLVFNLEENAQTEMIEHKQEMEAAIECGDLEPFDEDLRVIAVKNS